MLPDAGGNLLGHDGGDEGSSQYGNDAAFDPEFSKDFGKAYAKLVEKIYMEQGNTLLISQDEIMRLEHLVSEHDIFIFYLRKLLMKRSSEQGCTNLTREKSSR